MTVALPCQAMDTMSDSKDLPSTGVARTLITICTYNESANIARLIDAISGTIDGVIDADILVVDDNSPDGTGKIVDDLARRDSRIHVLHRAGKLGLGTAVLDAIEFAREHRYENILFLDGDFSHPPQFIPSVLAGMADHDIMIGSRYVPGGRIEGWDLKRHFMSSGINFFSRWCLGIKAHDCSGNYRCLRVEKVAQIPRSSIRSRGYSFQEEFLFRCQKLGCRIGETPITFVNRKHGKSNLNLREIVRSLMTLLFIAIRRG